MPEDFHAFHAAGAATVEPIIGIGFTWGAVDFTGVLGEASIEDPEVATHDDLTASLIKARKVQFPGSVYPKLNQTFTGGGVTYRVVGKVRIDRNDPFITIPVVEIQ